MKVVIRYEYVVMCVVESLVFEDKGKEGLSFFGEVTWGFFLFID